MRDLRKHFSINTGLVLTMFLLIFIGWQCWRNMRAMSESDQWENHTYIVIHELDKLLLAIGDVETSQRGYIITGDQEYLKPYRQALGGVDQHLAALKGLTRDNPIQQRQLGDLERLLRQRLANLKQTIDLRTTRGYQAAYEAIASGRGKELGDQIRNEAAQLQGEEDRLLQMRTIVKMEDTRRTAQMLLFGGLFSLVALVAVFLLLKRELLWRLSADKELRRHRDHLAEIVEERTRELQDANNHLKMEAEERGRSEEKYRIIVESATDYAIFTLDSRWCVTSWNSGAQHLLGYEESGILGRNMNVIFTEEDCRQGVPEADIRAVQASGRTRNDRWYRRKDGSLFWGIGIMVAQKDDRGTPIGYLKILQDITDRKLTQEQLERIVAERTAQLQESYRNLERLNAKLELSNRELQDFAFVASHDLQEPLRKVMAFGDLLIVDFGSTLGETGTDYLRRMHSAAIRMQALISDLLQFSRVTTKAQPFTTVNLNQVVAGVLTDLEVRIRESGGAVEVGALPTIESDPTQMRQLLQNLVGNALKFARPAAAPQVRVYAEQAPDAAGNEANGSFRLCVADNGIGFEEKYLDRIFTVFQRLHERRAYEGTGIGLAICRKIAERHGGSITAHSRPGEGSTFIVTLPLRQTAKTETTAP